MDRNEVEYFLTSPPLWIEDILIEHVDNLVSEYYFIIKGNVEVKVEYEEVSSDELPADKVVNLEHVKPDVQGYENELSVSDNATLCTEHTSDTANIGNTIPCATVSVHNEWINNSALLNNTVPSEELVLHEAVVSNSHISSQSVERGDDMINTKETPCKKNYCFRVNSLNRFMLNC